MKTSLNVNHENIYCDKKLKKKFTDIFYDFDIAE